MRASARRRSLLPVRSTSRGEPVPTRTPLAAIDSPDPVRLYRFYHRPREGERLADGVSHTNQSTNRARPRDVRRAGSDCTPWFVARSVEGSYRSERPVGRRVLNHKYSLG
jgi:hypothetical protein